MKQELRQPQSLANDSVKVLFIAGPTRSGSTIISNILGQIEGFFHAGEVIEAWDRGRIWKCSCGQVPHECVIWSGIFKSLNSSISAEDQAAIIRLRDKLSRSHKVILNHSLHPDSSTEDKPAAIYLDGLAKLYTIIKNRTGADVIVDSSKNVGYADTLSKVAVIDLHVVHLVRDSRATVFSWSKKKRELWQMNPLRASVEWISRNLASEFMKKRRPEKFINIRYEDFIENPRRCLGDILKVLNIYDVELPFLSPHEVIIKSSHGLCGNPGRYNHGAEKLAIDNRWKEMKKTDGLIATMLTWPLLLKYRYQLKYA